MKKSEFREFAAEKIYNSPLCPPEQRDRGTALFIADEMIRHYTGELYSPFSDGLLSYVAEAELMEALSRKLSGEPIQYIFGEWEFYGFRMFCGPGCLIPRPETELLAEYVIRNLPDDGVFLDLCTGSGCISVAVLNNRPDARCVAVDISDEALKYAKRNAELYGLSDRMKIVERDLLRFETEEKFDAVISNPPYIKTEDMAGLSVEVKKEPSVALDGGYDGLKFYRAIIGGFEKNLKEDGFFAFEAGEDTAGAVSSLLYGNGFVPRIIKDYSGLPRIVVSEGRK